MDGPVWTPPPGSGDVPGSLSRLRPWTGVLGLGQAMVDYAAQVDDAFLAELGLGAGIKGTRQVVGLETKNAVQDRIMEARSIRAGGSLTNTLLALARLGVRGDMACNIGSDLEGQLYRAELDRNGVGTLCEAPAGSSTGTVIVLTTPDAQRTMLSYTGTSSLLRFDAMLERAIVRSRVLVIEGYLWELPDTVDAIKRAVQVAKRHGVLVAFAASDVSCIRANRDAFLEFLAQDVQVLFANAEEAAMLAGPKYDGSAPAAAAALGARIPMVAVTDGSSGSVLRFNGVQEFIPSTVCKAVDTCGAGDAYAAGILYGIVNGLTTVECGDVASRVAAMVVAQQGSRLSAADADSVRQLYSAELHS